MGKRTFIGNFIHTSWTNLNIRCGKYRHLQTKKKCKTYSDIEIEFSREEYKQFCLDNEDIIAALNRPSLDRIDNSKNYILDNIQFIELSQNIRKEKLTFTDTEGTCFRCKFTKPIKEFVKDSRRVNNKTNVCKSCETIRCKAKDLRKS